MIRLVPSLRYEQAWQFPAGHAFRLISIDADQRRPAGGESDAEDEDEYVGPSGFKHAPGMSRLIRFLGG